MKSAVRCFGSGPGVALKVQFPRPSIIWWTTKLFSLDLSNPVIWGQNCIWKFSPFPPPLALCFVCHITSWSRTLHRGALGQSARARLTTPPLSKGFPPEVFFALPLHTSPMAPNSLNMIFLQPPNDLALYSLQWIPCGFPQLSNKVSLCVGGGEGTF